MRRWTRASSPTLCGHCGEAIQAGKPIVVIELANVTRKPVRCANCAGSPVPADLPAVIVPAVPIPPAMTKIGGLAFDWKAAQTGEAE